MAPESDDDRYRGVLDALSDISAQWREYRRQVNTSIGLLSSELVRLQKYIDEYARADAARWAGNDLERTQRQKRADRFSWAIVGAIVVLIVVNLVVLAFLAGKAS